MPAVTSSELVPRLSFRLPLDPARLLRARQRVRDYLYEGGLESEDVESIVLSLEEAMTNAVRHSEAEQDLEIMLRFEGRDLIAEVRDCGRGFDIGSFDPGQTPDPTAPGGRGLFLMGQLMDDLHLRCDGGLEVQFLKRDVVATEPKERGGRPLESAVPGSQAYRDERQRAFLSEIEEGFVALDWEYRFAYVNPAFEHLFPSMRGAILGRTLWEVFPLDHPAAEVYREAMELGKASTTEYVSPSLGRWIETRAYPTASGITVYARDIDERKRRELERDEYFAALLASEEKYRAIVETTDEGITIGSPDGTILFANQHLAEMLGYPVEELIGMSGLAITFEDEADAVKTARRELRAGRVQSQELRLRRKDGSALWSRYSAAPLFNPEGRHIANIVMHRDITEQRQALEELRESEERFAALFERSPFALALTKMPERTTVAVNAALERLFGFKRGELLGQTTMDLAITDAAAQDEIAAKLAAEGVVRDFECRRTTKSGEQRWVSISIDPVTIRDEEHVLSTLHDITERKQAEVERERLFADLERSLDRAGFLADVIERAEVPFGVGAPDGRLVLFNQAFADLTGYSRSELVERSLTWATDLTPPEWRETEERLLAEATRERRAVRYQKEYLRKDGGRVPIELVVQPIFNEAGELLHYRSFLTDVTERKRAEEDLEKLGSLLAEGQRIAHVGSFEYVAATQTTVWSDEERRIYGLAPGEPSPSYEEMLAGFIHPDDAALLHETFTRAMESNSVYELEHRIVRPDGEVRIVYDRARPYLDEDGTLIRYVGATLDITERKQADEGLRESDERLRQIAQAGQIGFFEWNDATKSFYWSTEHYQLFGYEPESQITWERWLESVHPEDRDRVLENSARLLEQARSEGAVLGHKDEFRIVRGDGSLVWLESDVSVSMDGGQAILRGMVRDITERKQAEEALRESEERLSAVLDNLPVGVWAVDATGRVTAKNKASDRIWAGDAPLSARPEDYGDYVAWDVETGKRLETDDYPLTTALRTGLPTAPVELRIRRFDGTEGFVVMSAVPLRDLDGSLCGAVGINVDISESKQTEEALRESEERERFALQHAPAAIYEIDPQGPRFLSVNDFMCSYSGYSREELLAMSPYDVLDDASRTLFRERIRQTLADEAVPATVEYRIRTKQGEERVAALQMRLRFEEGKPARAFVVAHDVTQRKRLEEALRDAEARSKELIRFAPTGIYEIDFRGPKFRSVNEAMCVLTGYQREELMAMNPLDFLDADSQRVFQERIAKGLAGEPIPDSVEYRARTKDGRLRDVVLNVSFTHTGGTIDGALVVGWDVTERKQAEEERQRLLTSVQHERDRLSALVNSMIDEIWFADAGGNLTLVNPAVWKEFGSELGDETDVEKIAASIEVYRPDGTPRPVQEAPPLRALRGEIVTGQEELLRTSATSQLRHRQVNAAPVRADDGTIIGSVAVVRDITDRKQAEEELRRLYEQQRQIATSLQQSFVHSLPELERLEVGLSEAPAWEPALIGGDFWDLFELHGGQVVAIVGDVAGKGIAAAGLTETVRSTMRAFAEVDATPSFVLRRTNDVLLTRAVDDLFVTALIVTLDTNSGELALASAGHPSPLHLEATGCHILEAPYGSPLGAFPTDYGTARFRLDSSDYLLLYTDGVTEARRSGELFGERRLRELAGSLYGRPCEDLAAAVREASEAFSNQLRDDLEVMVLRLK